jgi:hypothetical protein
MKEISITEPRFSGSDLAEIVGVNRKLVNRWLERDLFVPTEVERLPVRSRPRFSLVGVFKARLSKILYDRICIVSSKSMNVGETAELAAKKGAKITSSAALANLLADEGWMHAQARSIRRGKPLRLYAAITRSERCWQFFLELEVAKFASRFGSEIPYVVVPIGEIFTSVYRQCEAITRLGSQDLAAREKPQRARP